VFPLPRKKRKATKPWR